MIDKLSKILGITAFVLSAFVLGAYFGFGHGTNFCDVQYPIVGELGWVSDLDPYITYLDRQRIIILFILIFLVGKFIKNKRISHSICLISIIFSMYSIAETIYYKYKFWNETDKYLRLSRELFNYEASITLMLFTLFILEIVLVIQNFRAKQE